jgi:hypothetical protein
MTRYQVVHVGHVALKVVAQEDAAREEGVVVAVVLVVAAPKVAVGDAGPVQSGRERRQFQELSRIDDQVG